ncbi:polyprotein [Plasmopara halstedii]|uniref:Polyprotein n=1 Tax=Plasmopara halstedii TaxID=4781 RepID=A0A0P1ASY2_PLAHL|nr:polyprotein [Plasmopara halstedii]CEG45073.1 polyprotein [Plasmopara halstedii]|eukprot:XP_024581442.1 polyprotein [Plasmopara halstedii]
MDHLRVFGSHGYAHIDEVKRTNLEPKSFKCMFLGYAENFKSYRVFDLENAKIKVTRSVKLDEREVGGIYDTQEVKPERIIQEMKDGDEIKVQHQVDRQPVLDDPIEAVEEPVADVKMEDDEESTEGSEGPPTSKRARIDEDGLIVAAVLAYAVSIDDVTDLPTTYAQAMASDDVMKWREEMDAELRSHE